jgi:DNA gyrase/topoisomerase IV subunit B
MNAEQLWETTMDPARRTLMQVNIDNLTEADRIFSMLWEMRYHQEENLLRKMQFMPKLMRSILSKEYYCCFC